MGLRVPPLEIKILLEKNPLKSRIFSTEIGRIPRSARGGAARDGGALVLAATMMRVSCICRMS